MTITAYCTAADIASRLKGVEEFTTTTSPKLADVEAFIATASALIDSRVSGKYEIPVTGEGSLEVLRAVCVNLVLAEVEDIAFQGLSRISDGSHRIDRRKIGGDLLESIASGKMSLPDAAAKTAHDFANSNVEAGREFTIKKDEVQW